MAFIAEKTIDQYGLIDKLEFFLERALKFRTVDSGQYHARIGGFCHGLTTLRMQELLEATPTHAEQSRLFSRIRQIQQLRSDELEVMAALDESAYQAIMQREPARALDFYLSCTEDSTDSDIQSRHEILRRAWNMSPDELQRLWEMRAETIRFHDEVDKLQDAQEHSKDPFAGQVAIDTILPVTLTIGQQLLALVQKYGGVIRFSTSHHDMMVARIDFPSDGAESKAAESTFIYYDPNNKKELEVNDPRMLEGGIRESLVEMGLKGGCVPMQFQVVTKAQDGRAEKLHAEVRKLQHKLIQQGYYNSTDAKGHSSLHLLAMSQDHEHFLELLRIPQVNVNIQDKKGKGPLHYLVDLEKNDFIHDMLVTRDDVNINAASRSGTIFHLVARLNRYQALQQLLDYPHMLADIDVVSRGKHLNAFEVACQHNSVEVGRLLIRYKKAHPSAVSLEVMLNGAGRTAPAWLCVEHDSPEMFALLLEERNGLSNIDGKFHLSTDLLRDLFIEALTKGKPGMLKALLPLYIAECGPLDAPLSDALPPPLHLAVEKRQADCCKILLAHDEGLASVKHNDVTAEVLAHRGKNPGVLAAFSIGVLGDLLAESKLDQQHPPKDNPYPVHAIIRAAVEEEPITTEQIVAVCKAYPAYINCLDEEGESPLKCALGFNPEDPRLAAVLKVPFIADSLYLPNAEGNNIWHELAENHCYDYIETFVAHLPSKAVDCSYYNKAGQTALDIIVSTVAETCQYRRRDISADLRALEQLLNCHRRSTLSDALDHVGVDGKTILERLVEIPDQKVIQSVRRIFDSHGAKLNRKVYSDVKTKLEAAEASLQAQPSEPVPPAVADQPPPVASPAQPPPVMRR